MELVGRPHPISRDGPWVGVVIVCLIRAPAGVAQIGVALTTGVSALIARSIPGADAEAAG